MTLIRSRMAKKRATVRHKKIMRSKVIHHHHRRYAGIRAGLRGRAAGRRALTVRRPLARAVARRGATLHTVKKPTKPNGQGLAPISLSTYFSMI